MKVNPTAKPVNTVTYLGWGGQELADALEWHKANSPKATPEAFAGYEAGYMAAWVKALAVLKFQGMVVGDGK